METRGFDLDQAGLSEIAAMPFEKALAELEDIVTRLERGSVALEESIAIYERGEALKTHCDGLLRNAEMRIEKITVGPDGRPAGSEAFDAD
jgi:exodeoxyribonuclease VII small subunit